MELKDDSTLHRAIRKNGLHQKTRFVFEEFPILDILCSELACLIGDKFPGRAGAPLLVEMIRAGLGKMSQLPVTHQNRPAEFCVGLLGQSVDLFRREAIATCGPDAVRWIPLRQSWKEFISLYGHNPIDIREIEDSSISPLTAALLVVSRITYGEITESVVRLLLRDNLADHVPTPIVV